MSEGRLKCISFPTNVRSPRIIRSYLKVLVKYRFPRYDPAFEKEFLEAIAREGIYEGDISKLNAMSRRTQGRVRYGYLKSFGFCYESENRDIVITPAGWAFADDKKNPNEIWLNQMIKWQIPNPHLDPRTGYSEFKIHPFFSTLQIIDTVGWLTKEEIGLFVLTMRRNEGLQDVIGSIRHHRRLNQQEKEDEAEKVASKYRVKASHSSTTILGQP